MAVRHLPKVHKIALASSNFVLGTSISPDELSWAGSVFFSESESESFFGPESTCDIVVCWFEGKCFQSQDTITNAAICNSNSTCAVDWKSRCIGAWTSENLQMNRMPGHCRSMNQSAREREIAHLTAFTLLAWHSFSFLQFVCLKSLACTVIEADHAHRKRRSWKRGENF